MTAKNFLAGAPESVEAFIAELVRTRQLEDPLYVVDLGAVTRLFQAWQAALPRVLPFYAVKCFHDKAIISTLAALGAGFDCASESEVSLLHICLLEDLKNTIALDMQLFLFTAQHLYSNALHPHQLPP